MDKAEFEAMFGAYNDPLHYCPAWGWCRGIHTENTTKVQKSTVFGTVWAKSASFWNKMMNKG